MASAAMGVIAYDRSMVPGDAEVLDGKKRSKSADAERAAPAVTRKSAVSVTEVSSSSSDSDSEIEVTTVVRKSSSDGTFAGKRSISFGSPRQIKAASSSPRSGKGSSQVSVLTLSISESDDTPRRPASSQQRARRARNPVRSRPESPQWSSRPSRHLTRSCSRHLAMQQSQYASPHGYSRSPSPKTVYPARVYSPTRARSPMRMASPRRTVFEVVDQSAYYAEPMVRDRARLLRREDQRFQMSADDPKTQRDGKWHEPRLRISYAAKVPSRCSNSTSSLSYSSKADYDRGDEPPQQYRTVADSTSPYRHVSATRAHDGASPARVYAEAAVSGRHALDDESSSSRVTGYSSSPILDSPARLQVRVSSQRLARSTSPRKDNRNGSSPRGSRGDSRSRLAHESHSLRDARSSSPRRSTSPPRQDMSPARIQLRVASSSRLGYDDTFSSGSSARLVRSPSPDWLDNDSLFPNGPLSPPPPKPPVPPPMPPPKGFSMTPLDFESTSTSASAIRITMSPPPMPPVPPMLPPPTPSEIGALQTTTTAIIDLGRDTGSSEPQQCMDELQNQIRGQQLETLLQLQQTQEFNPLHDVQDQPRQLQQQLQELQNALQPQEGVPVLQVQFQSPPDPSGAPAAPVAQSVLQVQFQTPSQPVPQVFQTPIPTRVESPGIIQVQLQSPVLAAETPRPTESITQLTARIAQSEVQLQGSHEFSPQVAQADPQLAILQAQLHSPMDISSLSKTPQAQVSLEHGGQPKRAVSEQPGLFEMQLKGLMDLNQQQLSQIQQPDQFGTLQAQLQSQLGFTTQAATQVQQPEQPGILQMQFHSPSTASTGFTGQQTAQGGPFDQPLLHQSAAQIQFTGLPMTQIQGSIVPQIGLQSHSMSKAQLSGLSTTGQLDQPILHPSMQQMGFPQMTIGQQPDQSFLDMQHQSPIVPSINFSNQSPQQHPFQCLPGSQEPGFPTFLEQQQGQSPLQIHLGTPSMTNIIQGQSMQDSRHRLQTGWASHIQMSGQLDPFFNQQSPRDLPFGPGMNQPATPSMQALNDLMQPDLLSSRSSPLVPGPRMQASREFQFPQDMRFPNSFEQQMPRQKSHPRTVVMFQRSDLRLPRPQRMAQPRGSEPRVQRPSGPGGSPILPRIPPPRLPSRAEMAARAPLEPPPWRLPPPRRAVRNSSPGLVTKEPTKAQGDVRSSLPPEAQQQQTQQPKAQPEQQSKQQENVQESKQQLQPAATDQPCMQQIPLPVTGYEPTTPFPRFPFRIPRPRSTAPLRPMSPSQQIGRPSPPPVPRLPDPRQIEFQTNMQRHILEQQQQQMQEQMKVAARLQGPPRLPRSPSSTIRISMRPRSSANLRPQLGQQMILQQHMHRMKANQMNLLRGMGSSTDGGGYMHRKMLSTTKSSMPGTDSPSDYGNTTADTKSVATASNLVEKQQQKVLATAPLVYPHGERKKYRQAAIETRMRNSQTEMVVYFVVLLATIIGLWTVLDIYGRRTAVHSLNGSFLVIPNATMRGFNRGSNHNGTAFNESFGPGFEKCNSAECQAEGNYVSHQLNWNVNPCESMYEFVCSNSKMKLADEFLLSDLERSLLRQLSGPPATGSLATKLMQDLWKECLDEEARNRLGWGPLKHMFKATALADWPYLQLTTQGEPAIWQAAARALRYFGLSTLVLLEPSEHPLMGRGSLLALDKPVLLLRPGNDTSWYHEAVSLALSAVARKHTNKHTVALDLTNFARQLGSAVRSPGPSGDLVRDAKLERLRSVPRYRDLLTGFLQNESHVTDDTELLLRAPEYAIRLGYLLDDTAPHVVLNYIGFRLLVHVSPFLPDSLRKLVPLRARELGLGDHGPGRLVCLRAVEQATPTLFYRIVYESHRSLLDSLLAADLGGALKQALASRLALLQWLDGETRDRALQRLQQLEPKLLFPDWVTDSMKAEQDARQVPHVIAGEALRSYARITKELMQRRLQTADPWLGQLPSDPECWLAPGRRVLYVPLTSLNTTAPAQEPFLLLQLAKLGERAARCLVRLLLDGAGSHTDDPRAWWAPAARQGLAALQKCYALQSRDGERPTAAEESAALVVAHTAFEARSPALDLRLENAVSMSLDQLFFVHYALGYCAAEPDVAHRVNLALLNFAGFQRAFTCDAGTPMNPRKSCDFW